MIQRQERRTPGVNRVAVARLVDICGRDPTVPAFEAESVEVSGRGMHVKTPYLPPLGAPLVCRLEDDGREIVVEGVVAWQSERSDGGEFGVQFTALDSGSVEALKALCGLGPRPGAEKRVPAPPQRHEPEIAASVTGAPVKLHIDGLGAPMKARVKGGSPRKLQVGSNLEFLKVGKNLQIEDVEQGEKRGARIDAVSIALDPETQIPQLVVVLRYEGEDKTPEPSVVGDEAAPVADRLVHDDGEKRVASARASSDQDDQHDQEDQDDEALDEDAETSAAAMRGPVDQFAASVGKSAMATSQKLAAASGVAAKGLAGMLKAGGAKFLASRAAAASQAKRRSTAPAPQSTVSREPRLRPQNAPVKDEAPAQPRRKLAVVGGASVLVIAAVAFALNSRSKAEPRPTVRSAESSAMETPAPVVANAPSGPAVPGNAALAANAMGAAAQQSGQRGVVANVPLFGATPMATVEPAPLGPLPDEITAMSPKSRTQAADEERLDDEDPRSVVQDESFDDGKSKPGKKDLEAEDKSPDAVAEAVKPFGLGKMHLPVVYRIKLDKPGAALEGRSQGSGFTVTIPGRKAEGSSSAITKRDDRIAEVKMKNGPTGAVVSFVFRSKVPSYKVRLRKSYLEVFVSSPDSAR
jgi:hypothetical protein